ncbi:class I SAM-dependent methyltransferase [Flavobacterium agricola]|uniref:Class I SAM-dependent methyltransferase n=1 Tax=Flavobacterium agricola TaxID=2870839 RepID=A0ABY6M1E4_9FLAO|nr:class I SAM-dependent methyltransferase [Flavobacterium agricola]UYW02072.1 class I SAM-dependent methyltransferase [Flavobacterium agricola]
MPLRLLNPEVQKFINQNLTAQITELALTKNPFPDLVWADVLNQIVAKQKSKTKLPTWFAAQSIVYPSKLSVEQTSSEATAAYKAQLISGNSLIDLTGGFGVDVFYFAKYFKRVVHCEMNEKLSQIVAHNCKEFGLDHVVCKTGDSTEILKDLNETFDWIYVDPSRRNDIKGKVFMLKDCLPNVPELLDYYFTFSNSILIKNSPILDISLAISELKFVKKVHIIALENEVKEFLLELELNFDGAIEVQTVNISKSGNQVFTHLLQDDAEVVYSIPKQFVYEPNAAIMKSGLFHAIANTYKLTKLHAHSHLYTSDHLVTDFPGRSFKVENSFEFTKINANEYLKNKKMNLTTRNFPVSVEELRKKYKIADGGSVYAFATTTSNQQKTILICSKI